MVRTYWLVSVFNEASDNLDLQPFARTDQVEACRPRAMCLRLYGVGNGRARIGRDRDRRGGAGGGLRGTARRRRARGGDCRAAPGRRRVLLLRLHAAEGPAAPGRAVGGVAARAGR